MGTFNTVRGRAICPNCANEVEVVAQFKYGHVWQIQYNIGDMLQWGRNKVGMAGIHHVVVDAVVEPPCPSCGSSKEWNLYLHIRDDKLAEMETAHGQYDFAKARANFIIVAS